MGKGCRASGVQKTACGATKRLNEQKQGVEVPAGIQKQGLLSLLPRQGPGLKEMVARWAVTQLLYGIQVLVWNPANVWNQ